MLINNHSRISQASEYFLYAQPYAHAKRTPSRIVYSYSFALYPESEDIHSGSLNLSRIDNVVFRFTMKSRAAAGAQGFSSDYLEKSDKVADLASISEGTDSDVIVPGTSAGTYFVHAETIKLLQASGGHVRPIVCELSFQLSLRTKFSNTLINFYFIQTLFEISALYLFFIFPSDCKVLMSYPHTQCYWCKESGKNVAVFEMRWENTTKKKPANVHGEMCAGCLMERGLFGKGYALYFQNGSRLRISEMGGLARKNKKADLVSKGYDEQYWEDCVFNK